MAIYTAAYDDDLSFHDAYGRTGYGSPIVDRVGLDAAFGTTGFSHTQIQGLGFHTAYFGFAYLPGAAIGDVLKLHDAMGVQSFFGLILAQGLGFHDALSRAIQVALVQGMSVHPALALARAVTVLQRLGLHDALSPNSTQALALVEAIGLDAEVLAFFGFGLYDGFKIHPSHAPTFGFSRTISTGIDLHAVLAGSLYWQVTVPEGIELEDSALVNMLYQGDPLSDGFAFSIATVDPGGGFTTWSINTRTGAVSEYQNFAFNSYCRMGNQFYGANSQGLFLLNNETDNGANIIADIKGGLLNIGGARFTQLDNVYLGIDANSTGREWVLKLILPNNKQPDIVYTYYFSPRDLQTTKVNIGKGLRTRYMQWELVVPGEDFDLDAIEFVPIIAKRRV